MLLSFQTLLSDWIDQNHATWTLIQGHDTFSFINLKKTHRHYFEVDGLVVRGVTNYKTFVRNDRDHACDKITENFMVTAHDHKLFDKLSAAMFQIEYYNIEPASHWIPFTGKRLVYNGKIWKNPNETI